MNEELIHSTPAELAGLVPGAADPRVKTPPVTQNDLSLDMRGVVATALQIGSVEVAQRTLSHLRQDLRTKKKRLERQAEQVGALALLLGSMA